MMAFYLSLLVSAAAADDDLVERLPGLNHTPSFKLYAGRIAATGDAKLFYFLATSKRSPETDPLVLWLQGGPGCSSLLGMLTER